MAACMIWLHANHLALIKLIQILQEVELTIREGSRNQSNTTRHCDGERGSTRFVSIHGPYLLQGITIRMIEFACALYD